MKRHLLTLLKLAICAALLAWIFDSIFMQEGKEAWTRSGKLWSDLSSGERRRFAWTEGSRELWLVLLASPGAFAASTGLIGVVVALGLVRWKRVLQSEGLDLSWTRTSAITLVGGFFNSFLLGSTGGDLMKAWYAARATHHRKAEAVATVVLDRLLGFWSMLFFAVLAAAWNWKLIVSEARYQAAAALIAALFTACTIFCIVVFWGGISRFWPKARQALRRFPKGAAVEQGLESFRNFGRKPGLLLQLALFSMGLNFLCVVQVWILSRGLDAHASFPVLLVIIPMITVVSALPITPSGLGVRENLFVALLSAPAIGVDSTKALALSLLAYAGTVIWSALGGIVYFFVKSEVPREEPLE